MMKRTWQFAFAAKYISDQKKSMRRWWVHPIFCRRNQFGVYHTLVRELSLDAASFQRYLRMSREQFGVLLSYLEPHLYKVLLTREPMSPRERICLGLRYLATGQSFRSLSFQHRIGVSTVAMIIREVCQCIWDCMAGTHLHVPIKPAEWRKVAEGYQHLWGFPHCAGAIDGKHVVITAPANTGSMHFNYKSTFSIALMALVDANCSFIFIDVGSYGRNSDGGVFSNSSLGKALSRGILQLPEPEILPGGEQIGPIPYVSVGDEAFPLQHNLMRPYPGQGTTVEQKVFNYRLSRARSVVECAFGILAARWRVYHTKICCSTELANNIVKATCVLHNFLQVSVTEDQIASLMNDADQSTAHGLCGIHRVGNRAGADAMIVRERFKEYFTKVNALDWQIEHVCGGSFLA